MIKGGKEYKTTVVDILSKSFEDNQSINYIVKQDGKRVERIKRLMSYCFEMCLLKGQIFLSEDKNACALILDSEKKTGVVKSAFLDLKLATGCIGIFRVGKIMRRERMIKASQPKESFYYLWFIGVNPNSQGQNMPECHKS